MTQLIEFLVKHKALEQYKLSVPDGTMLSDSRSAISGLFNWQFNNALCDSKGLPNIRWGNLNHKWRAVCIDATQITISYQSKNQRLLKALKDMDV